MTKCFLILISLILFGCHPQRIFYFQSQNFSVPESSKPVEISSESYTLYTRQLCFSQQEGYQNCPPEIPDNSHKVEIDYLFISKTDDKVIYITNFPDKFEHIYQKEGFADADNYSVNSWYFSKIFIGTLNRQTNNIKFIYGKPPKGLEIHAEFATNGTITFTSLSEISKKPPVLRDIQQAIIPLPTFFEKKSFSLVFNQFLKKQETEVRNISILNHTLYFHHRGLFFQLSEPWKKNKSSWVKYKSNRVITSF